MKKIIFAAFILLLTLSSLCWAQTQPAYWTGDGGKGKSITISPLDGAGLAENEARLPYIVANELGTNFRDFSAMAVFDSVNYDQQVNEYLSRNIYDENDPAQKSLFHEKITEYMLSGNITRTATGYALQIRITQSADKMTAFSYSGIFTFAELNDFTGVRRASLELLQKMGVQLTARARAELTKAATSKRVNAQIALANSETAKTDFEKQYYTYQANQLDPTLTEAARRVAAYQTEIYKAPQINLAMPDIRIPEIRVPEFKAPEVRMAATGNIGADARRQQEQYNAQKEASRARQESGNQALKDLQDAFLEQFKVQSEAVKRQQADLLKQRDSLLEQQRTLLARQGQMIAQLRETENSYDTFFNEHPPFEIIYDPAVKPVGNANLEKGTIDMQFAIASVGTQAMEVIPRMLADFEKGLGTITQGLRDINAEFDKIAQMFGRAETAGSSALGQLANDYAAQVAKVEAAESNYAAQLARLDTQLKTSGYAQLGRDYAVRPDTGYAERLAMQYAVQPAGYFAAKDKTLGSEWSLSKWNKDEQRTFAIEARLENDKGKTIGRADVTLTNRISAAAYTRPMSDSAFVVFRDVPVNDITDTLKVSIQRVNGRDVTAVANADYIKISPLEADGYTKDGWNIDGYGKNGRNQMGLTRQETERPAREAENARKKANWQRQVNDVWGYRSLDFFIGGAAHIQPSGGLFEFGGEFGGKWLVVDVGFGWGNGSLKLDDEIVEKVLGSIFAWEKPHIFSPRVGAAIPIKFPKARLNIGGGFEWLNIKVTEIFEEAKIMKDGGTMSKAWRNLDTLFTPYVGARLDLALTKYGGLLLFISYRCEFPPADKMETYFGNPSSVRHTIFAGFEGRIRTHW